MAAARLGLEFVVPNTLTRVAYYGRGPHENYVDRKASALVDVYRCQVADMYVPYIFPAGVGHGYGLGQNSRVAESLFYYVFLVILLFLLLLEKQDINNRIICVHTPLV